MIMKILALLVLIILVFPANAGSFKLGSHLVSLNLSVPANYTMEKPLYQEKVKAWWYPLQIIPNIGMAYIRIQENTHPIYSKRLLQDFAAYQYQGTKNEGVSGFRYNIIDYKGKPALETYTPRQKLYRDDRTVDDVPEYFSLIYQLDEKTIVIVEARDINQSFFKEIMDSMEIIRS